MKAGIDTVLVRIESSQREEVMKSPMGIHYAVDYHPLAYLPQYGTVLSAGKNVKHIKKGDTLFFSHLVSDEPNRIMEQDSNGSEVWAIMQFSDRYYTEIYGWERNGELFCNEDCIVTFPEVQDIPDYFGEKTSTGLFKMVYVQNTMRHFKSKVEGVNPEEIILKVGDLILCQPRSNYEIRWKDKTLWFISQQHIQMTFDADDRLAVFDKPRGSEEKKLTKDESKKFVLTEIN